MCPAQHLAFQQLEAVDVSLDRAGTPGQGHPSFDCLLGLLAPARKAWQGLQRTGRRARAPGIEARRLPLADEVGKVLCQVDRLSDLGRLRVELGELLGFGRRAALGAASRAGRPVPLPPAGSGAGPGGGVGCPGPGGCG